MTDRFRPYTTTDNADWSERERARGAREDTERRMPEFEGYTTTDPAPRSIPAPEPESAESRMTVAQLRDRIQQMESTLQQKADARAAGKPAEKPSALYAREDKLRRYRAELARKEAADAASEKERQRVNAEIDAQRGRTTAAEAAPALVQCRRCGLMIGQDAEGDMLPHIAIGHLPCPAERHEWTRPRTNPRFENRQHATATQHEMTKQAAPPIAPDPPPNGITFGGINSDFKPQRQRIDEAIAKADASDSQAERRRRFYPCIHDGCTKNATHPIDGRTDPQLCADHQHDGPNHPEREPATLVKCHAEGCGSIATNRVTSDRPYCDYPGHEPAYMDRRAREIAEAAAADVQAQAAATADADNPRLQIECPQCHAAAGERCTNYKGQHCHPHGARKPERAPAARAAKHAAKDATANRRATVAEIRTDTQREMTKQAAAKIPAPSDELVDAMAGLLTRHGFSSVIDAVWSVDKQLKAKGRQAPA